MLLLVLSPLLLLISITLFIIHGQVFFVQQRPGYLEIPFNMYKFITMSNDFEKTDEQRITTFGKVLRKLSLDELPQLVNILKGEMSFIGPRPLLMEYVSLYSDYHSKRHIVMPGITGLAQVWGKNRLDWTRKLDLDVEYVEKIGLTLDLKIVMLTIRYFLNGCPGSYPAEKFTGYSTN